MKKTLQDQYLLIKEGKGHKGVFLTEAKREFPQYIRNAATFDEAVASLKTKNIISENVISVMPAIMDRPKKESYETAFESFLAEARKTKENEDEKVKAEEKKPIKKVEEDASHNFNNSDEKNPDNMIFGQIMMGYYAEMKDPKNADKTMQELKDIVFKNLAKDQIYYTKNAQFGVKDLGYTDEAPALGEPKEAKGKYKSSGYGDLNEGIFDRFKSKPLGDVEGAKKDIKKAMVVFLQKNTNLKNADTFTDKELLKAIEGFARHGERETSSNANKIASQIYKVAKPLFEAEVEKFVSDVKDAVTKKGDKKFSPEEIKAKLAQKRKEELERRKEAGESLEEIALREVIQNMIFEELNSEEFEDTLYKLEQPHLGDKEALDAIQKIYSRHSAGLNSISQNLQESVEKDLADINKEAEHEVLQAKLDKIDALIDHRRSKLSKLDEDEDMKALTDKKKVKELEKDIKKLEVARKKVEKMMSKFKGKKTASKEVIDETEGEDELPLETPAETSAEYLEYKEDAENRYDAGESIDSILDNYNNISSDMKEMLRNDLEGKMNGMDY